MPGQNRSAEAAAPTETVRPSVCPLDCPDTCSLSVTVDDDTIVRVRGSKVNPYTGGVICDKVSRYYPDFVHGERRIREPLLRTGPRGSGQFSAISWDEAIDRVHQGFSDVIKRFGAQSVMPFNYAGPHGQLAGGSMDRRFFHRLGASLLDRGPLCGAVRGTAYSSLFGAAPGMPPEQLVHSDLIAVWGNNVTVSNLHLARVIKAARDRHNAQLIVVDSRRTKIAEQADLFVQVYPGTDVVLALALAAEFERRDQINHGFIERWVHGYDAFMAQARQISVAQACKTCRIERASFDALADAYCQAQTLGLSIGNGIERSRNGGASLRAIMALNALLGQFGRQGAGVFAKAAAVVPLTGDRLQRPDLIPEGTRTINIVDVGKLLLDPTLDPPIKALFIYNHNPVSTHPDQNRMRRALSQDDLFIAGSDVTMTDSMQYADVVLPACSHFEHDDLFAPYGQNYLQRAEPVIAAVGQALPNTEIFRRLAARFAFDDPVFTDTDAQLMDDAVNDQDARLNGVSGSALDVNQALALHAPDNKPAVMCDSILPATPSGKIELYSEAMEQAYGAGLPRFIAIDVKAPYNLISPSSSKRTNATFGGDEASGAIEQCEFHPDDAEQLGLSDGQLVTLTNDLGQAQVRVRISDVVAPGVIYSPKGTWLHTSATDQTVNALIDADLRSDIADGACYNDTHVHVSTD